MMQRKTRVALALLVSSVSFIHARELRKDENEASSCPFLKVCCGNDECQEAPTGFTTKEEVKDFGVCQHSCPDKKCSWSWRKSDCDDGGAKAKTDDGGAKANTFIECAVPDQRKVKKEGINAVCDRFTVKDVPYNCDGGSQLCCTESTTERFTFVGKKLGECRKMGEGGPPLSKLVTNNPTTANPTTANPTTANPTTSKPTSGPTANPTTMAPTTVPTLQATYAPTENPSTQKRVTSSPTKKPTPDPVFGSEGGEDKGPDLSAPILGDNTNEITWLTENQNNLGKTSFPTGPRENAPPTNAPVNDPTKSPINIEWSLSSARESDATHSPANITTLTFGISAAVIALVALVLL